MKNGVENHFKEVFRDLGNLSIVDQLVVVQKFPRFFTKVRGEMVAKEVTLNEVLEVLRRFENDKSLGLNGWYLNFFLAFFDILGKDLLDVVNEARSKGKVACALNAVFILLIPQGEKPNFQ